MEAKNTLNSDSQRGYNHSWRLCLTSADHRPSLQTPGSWEKHEPELNREEHLLQFSSPHLSTSAVPFSLSSVGVICPGSPSPSRNWLTTLFQPIEHSTKGSGLHHPSILSLYFSFSSPEFCFFRLPVDFVLVSLHSFLPFLSLLCRFCIG